MAYGKSDVEKLDIFRTKQTNAPIFVFIHGGAWRIGVAKFHEFSAEMFFHAGAHYIALDFMNIKAANEEIYKALNSRNEILRMEAQIALVRLSDGDPFEFLFNLKRPFSLWEQITLHELIVQHDIPVPPFNKFLRAENPTIVMFALRMIREFKQRDAEDEVREIMEHTSPEVRRLSVEIAGDLEMRSTLDVMKRMYKSQDYHTCVEIIRAMAKMPDPSLMGFLKLVLDKEDDVQLQIEATKAIENNGEEGVRTLVKLMKSEYKNYNIIVRHVLDRRIY